MRTTLLIIVVAICACSLVRAQRLQHPTPVSASIINATSPDNKIRGSLGQAFIGRVKIPNTNTIQGVGFWYRPEKSSGSVVVIPATEGEIGSHVTIPVLLTKTTKTVSSGPRNFIIKLRYNRTVLVYKGPFTVTQSGGENVLTVTGSTSDTVGILAQLNFLVTLGNAERTDIVIDTVEWQGAPSHITTRVNGSFQALGVCKEGNTIRLIHRKSTTAITSVAPQPAVDHINVEVMLGADGPMSLHLIDLTGATVSAQLYVPDAKAGKHKSTFEVSDLISGSYYLVLQTSEFMQTASVIIRK